MGCKLTRAGEGPGCDEATAAAAAAGSSSDCGDAATRRSASVTPSTSTLPTPTPSSPSTPPAPTPSSPSTPPAPTPSSPSPPPAPTPLSPTASSPSPSTSSSSASPPQSPSLTPSSLSSADESSTSTPSSTSSTDEEDQWEEERYLQSIEIPHPQEIARGEEQEVDQLKDSYGSTDLFSESEEFCHISESDDDGVFSNKFKLGDKEPVLTLLEEFEDDTIIGKIMLLDEKYGSRRRIARDGSCFYRSFIFKYLENVVEIKDEDERRTEAARFRRRVENCMPACHDDQLLHSFSGYESVVNLVEQGLAEGELYQMDMNEDVTSRIIPLLRALTEIEICTRPEFYHGFLIPGETYASVFEFCLCEVRQGEANNMQVHALAHALGIPVILENLDVNTPGQLNTLHIGRPVESEAEAPLALTLLYRSGHYDIIYPK
ncbi:hypothetical protein QYE76_067850 [Lolium multiflorum]|uniref:ubiquitinyl hydrolase 1 n=1 Tax=Lolium multiflorum TaxID=4521 RepID=A0AAD8WC23_LOLMU|nr:hypothetical protein QYE76_067850 [Lolium multiflorum]